MDALVVPRSAFDAQPIEELPEAPARIARHRVRQRRDHRHITPARRHRRLVVRRSREPHYATGSLHRQLMLAHQRLGDLSLRGRPYSFRFRTALMPAFSSARSAYIRFSLAFSASSSRNRFTSDTDAPPYFPRHLKNVALLTLYFRR